MNITASGKKIIILSVSVITVIFIIFLIQTYGKAFREDGYDLTSYLLSSEALIRGTNPYTTGSPFPYIYPLFLASVLTPLLLVPYTVSVLLWFTINSAAFFYSVKYIFKTNDTFEFKVFKGLPLLLLVLFLIDVLQNNLLNGQINFVVLCLSIFYFYFLYSDKPVAASLFISAAAAIKIVPFFFLIAAFRKGRYNVLFYSAILTAVFVFIFPYLFAGSSLVDYYNYYFNNFLAGAAGTAHKGEDIFFTLHGFLGYLFPVLSGFNWLNYISALIIISVILFLHFRYSEPKAGIYLFSLYAIGILFITPMSETHHLIYILPAVSILIYELIVNKRYNDMLLFIGSVLFAVLFWTGAVLKGGPYHFSALLILFILMIIEMKKKVNDGKTADQV